MAPEPWFVLLPAAGALLMVGLALSIHRRRATLGGAAPDWVAAYLLAAGAFGGAVAASADDWNAGGDLAAGLGAAGGMLGLTAALSGLLQRYTRGSLGTPRFRLALFVAAVAISGLGFGAAIGASGAVGDGNTSMAAVVPAAAGFAFLLSVLVQTARKARGRAKPIHVLQLAGGAGLVGAGLLTVVVGEFTIGPWAGIPGAVLLFNGINALAGAAPAPRAPTVTPKVEEPTLPTRGGSGRKVRVPKGGAMRVTSFRDDEPGEVK